MQIRIIRIAAMIAALAVMIAANAAFAVSPSDYDVNTPENLQAEHLYCESALLVDAETGEILFTNNSRVRMFPASTTKIVTLYLGIKSGIDLEEVITVPDEAADIASGSSVIPVKPGDELRWGDLLYSFMMTSGNDGANAIAVLTSGSISAFVEKMNAWVTEIGCEGTHFTNAHGLHNDEHYTTARDLALMTRIAMEDEVFRDIVACAELEMPVRRNGEIKKRTVVTRNNLLIKDQKYYYADCIGVKTGHTGKAGYCFVGAAERDGMRVISVVLNCPEDHHKWYDSAKLFEYGFTQYESISVKDAFDAVRERIARLYVNGAAESDENGGYLDLDISGISNAEASLKAVRGNEVSYNHALDMFAGSAEVSLNENVTAPVNAGDVLGSLSFTSYDGTPVTAQLTASRSVEKQPDPTPTPEPTRKPVFASDGDGRIAGIIGTLVVVFVLVLVVGLIISAIGAARRKKRRKMMERRRREQMRRQIKNRSADGYYGNNRAVKHNRDDRYNGY